MKKKLLFTFILFFSLYNYSQITIRSCGIALGEQNYILNNTGTTVDAAGITRNTFESTPLDFTQTCPIGNCELRIIWSVSNTRWEIQLDNNGPEDTVDYDAGPLFYNTNASYPNPPSLNLGVWTDTLKGGCKGDLTTANGTLTGDVQDTTLSMENLILNNQISMYPNPTSNEITIQNNSTLNLKNITISNINGDIIKTVSFKDFKSKETIDTQNLQSGIYIVTIQSDSGKSTRKLIIN